MSKEVKNDKRLKKVVWQLEELGVRPDSEFNHGFNEGIRQAIMLLEFEYAGFNGLAKLKNE